MVKCAHCLRDVIGYDRTPLTLDLSTTPFPVQVTEGRAGTLATENLRRIRTKFARSHAAFNLACQPESNAWRLHHWGQFFSFTPMVPLPANKVHAAANLCAHSCAARATANRFRILASLARHLITSWANQECEQVRILHVYYLQSED